MIARPDAPSGHVRAGEVAHGWGGVTGVPLRGAPSTRTRVDLADRGVSYESVHSGRSCSPPLRSARRAITTAQAGARAAQVRAVELAHGWGWGTPGSNSDAHVPHPSARSVTQSRTGRAPPRQR